MANISDAHGAVYLEGVWIPEQIKAIAYILFTQETGYYNTIWDTSIFKEFEEGLQKEFSATFVGNGRWAFASNLEYLNSWYKIGKERWDKDIKNNLNSNDMLEYDDYLQLAQWVIDQMAEHELKLLWEYMDMETGCQFMCSVTGTHVSVFDPGELRQVLQYTENVVESWDCNLKNQCEQFFEGEYDILYEVVDNIIRLYKLPQTLGSAIEALIKGHETWYNIPAYPYYEKKTDLPISLRKAILLRIKGVVPW
jgi:hypothetical protein